MQAGGDMSIEATASQMITKNISIPDDAATDVYVVLSDGTNNRLLPKIDAQAVADTTAPNVAEDPRQALLTMLPGAGFRQTLL